MAGVRTNVLYPDVKCIGLGAGSIVRRHKTGRMFIGPDSVGYQIQEKPFVVGVNVPTVTDYTVLTDSVSYIGERKLVAGSSPDYGVVDFQAKVIEMLQRIIHTMKTSAKDLPVILGGRGAVIAHDTLKGASKVIRPKWAGAAIAMAAATARVSGIADTIESTAGETSAQVMEEVSKRAIERAVTYGMLRETV